jgi:hypothetical protein
MVFSLLVQIKQYLLQLELAQQLLVEHLVGLIQHKMPLRILQQKVCLRLAVLTTHLLAAQVATAPVVLAQLNSPAAQAEVHQAQTAVVVVVRLGRVE